MTPTERDERLASLCRTNAHAAEIGTKSQCDGCCEFVMCEASGLCSACWTLLARRVVGYPIAWAECGAHRADGAEAMTQSEHFDRSESAMSAHDAHRAKGEG